MSPITIRVPGRARRWCVACLFLLAQGGTRAQAVDRLFTSLFPASWHDAGNWSPLGVPGDGDRALINGGLGPLAAKCVFSDPAGGHVDILEIATTGSGRLEQSTGTLLVDDYIYLGSASFSGEGIFTIKGDGVTTAGAVHVGVGGGATLALGDTAKLNAFYLSVGDPGVGFYEKNAVQSDSATVNVTGVLPLLPGLMEIGKGAVGSYENRGGTNLVDVLLIGAGTHTGKGSYFLDSSWGKTPVLTVNVAAIVGGGLETGVTGSLHNAGGTIDGPGEVFVEGTKGQLYGTGKFDVRITYHHDVNVRFAKNALSTATILNVAGGLTANAGTAPAIASLTPQMLAAHNVYWGGGPGAANIVYSGMGPFATSIEVPYAPASVTGVPDTPAVPAANVAPRVRLWQLGQDMVNSTSGFTGAGNKAGELRNITGPITTDGTTTFLTGSTNNAGGNFDVAVQGVPVKPLHQDPALQTLHYDAKYKLDGKGVVMGQIEPGLPYPTQGCFDDWADPDPAKLRIFYPGGAPAAGGSSGHSTYVASVMIGYDPLGIQVNGQSVFEPAANQYNGGLGFSGVAPAATLHSINWGAAPNFGDFQTLAAVPGMKVINMSAGRASGSANGTQIEERVVDHLVEKNGIVFVKSAGNSGQDAAGNTVNASLTVPAGNYNGIAVGNVEFDPPALNAPDNAYPRHFDVTHARVDETSSRGPTNDGAGRAKPDLVAQGTGGLGAFTMEGYIAATQTTVLDPAYPEAGNRGLYSTQGRLGAPTATSSNTVAQSGTSFAAPMVSGTAALMVQQGEGLEAKAAAQDPRVIKSILQTSADKRLPGTSNAWEKGKMGDGSDNGSSVPLSYEWGAGLLDPVGAIDLLKAGRRGPDTEAATGPNRDGWDLGTLTAGAGSGFTGLVGNVYHFAGLARDSYFTGTLNWYRHVDAAFAASPLVNLNLFLYTYNPLDLSFDLVDLSNSVVDNVEHIWLQLPKDGDYLLRVTAGLDVAFGTHETYGLSWDLTPLVVPEPASLALLLVGCLGVIAARRRGWPPRPSR